jgi:hypothetical protein
MGFSNKLKKKNYNLFLFICNYDFFQNLKLSRNFENVIKIICRNFINKTKNRILIHLKI